MKCIQRLRSRQYYTYSRVEDTAADTEEDPNVDCQGEAKSQRYVQKRPNVDRPTTAEIVGHLRSGKGEEQEKKRSDELASAGNEQVTASVGKPSEAR